MGKLAPIILAILLFCPHARANSGTDMPAAADTVADEKKRNGLSRLIQNTISAPKRDRQAELEAARKDMEYFSRYDGKTIGQVVIVRNNVFDRDTERWGERKVNAIHRLTRESQIRKDLFIRPGDVFDAATIIRNRRLIRSRDYISDVSIEAVPADADTSTVDLIVTTRDKWTISLDAEVSSNGNSFVKLYDDNILGWGHMFAISTYINYKNGHYGGNVFEYENPNIMGTFFSGRLIAGHGFDHTDYGAEIKKEFIRPTDYGAGASFYYQKEPIGIYPLDSTVQSRDREWNLWFGKSRYIRGLNSSFFFTGRYNDLRFTQRPDVADTLNPYFHNKRSVLLSVGLYRERFRTSNLIYGYGVNEDIAYGFRFTLTGGHTWGEFGNRWYVGGDFSAGYFTSFGYMRWSIELGSYINTRDGKFYRTALVSNINYFSNLLGTGRYKVRQFLNFNYTRGWNRLDGYRESIGFVDEARLRGLRENVYGCHRLVGTSETVVFTPWKIHEFRFAMYGFADLGLIGNDMNLFGNRFFSTIGVGVRIKNENLVFGTINIRLGIALSGDGFRKADYFHISSEQRKDPLRYIPEQAAPVDYR